MMSRKIDCPVCFRTVSCNTFKVHVVAKHPELLVDFECETDIPSNCPCGNKIKNQASPENVFLSEMVGSMISVRKYCSRKCIGRFQAAWNKGNTKESCEVSREASERMKENNPVHQILSDPAKRREWFSKIASSQKEFHESRKGKTLEEMYGQKRSSITRQNMAKAARKTYKQGRVHHLLGKNHTKETKEKIRLKTIEQLSNSKYKVSKPQRELFQALEDKGFTPMLEYKMKYYSIDIAFPEKKIAIEMDGDFWHVNEEKGFSPIFQAQKKNIANDMRKNSYLKNAGWTVIRVWQSTWEEDNGTVLGEICQVLN